MNIKYSVIIPIYNAERTIERCLNSLLSQNYGSYEIILINDGSTDNTGEICRRYSEQYSKICYIEKENIGVSSARNVGIENAKGDYIAFVDSDDYVMDNYFAEIDVALQDECDLLMFGKVVFWGTQKRECPIVPCKTKKREETFDLISFAMENQLLNAPWNKIYRRDIIEKKKLRFAEELTISEDKVFVFQYLMNVQKITFISTPLYAFSRENKNSLSRKKRKDLCDQVLKEHELLFEALDVEYLPTTVKSRLQQAVCYSFYRSAYTVIKELRKFDYNRDERLNHAQEICKKYAACNVHYYRSSREWIISIPIRWKLVKLIDAGLTMRGYWIKKGYKNE